MPGITGFELNYCGSGRDFDRFADGVWRGCLAGGRPFLWGYAADDTHASGPKGLSWFVARLASRDEAALKQALRGGACYVSCGPGISAVRASGTKLTVDLEQEAEVAWLRAGQFLGPKLGRGVDGQRRGRCGSLPAARPTGEVLDPRSGATGRAGRRVGVRAGGRARRW